MPTQIEHQNPREMHVRPSFRLKVRPLFAAIGLVPLGEPVPDLSRWRLRYQRRHG